MEGIPTYDELRIRIRRGEPGSYHVEATAQDRSTGRSTFSLSDTELSSLLSVVARAPGLESSRALEWAKALGGQLFEFLITDEVRDVYLGAQKVAENTKRGLRLTLCMNDAPELLAIPWEFLYDKPTFLARSSHTPVVRSLELRRVRAPAELTWPLRILGVTSSPRGYEGLNVEGEKENLQKALHELEGRGRVKLDWLEHATLEQLGRRLDLADQIHVLHYIGHGTYHEDAGGCLVLEDGEGGPEEVRGDELAPHVADERSLQLVVLNSCEGAKGSPVDPFAGVAASLMENQIPAVIAMQFPITDAAAIKFADRLYDALAQASPIDAAVAQARKAISAKHDIEFATPVLFLRAGDARLFEDEPAQEAAVEDGTPRDVTVDVASAGAGKVVRRAPGISEAGRTAQTGARNERSDAAVDVEVALPISYLVPLRHVEEELLDLIKGYGTCIDCRERCEHLLRDAAEKWPDEARKANAPPDDRYWLRIVEDLDDIKVDDLRRAVESLPPLDRDGESPLDVVDGLDDRLRAVAQEADRGRTSDCEVDCERARGVEQSIGRARHVLQRLARAIRARAEQRGSAVQKAVARIFHQIEAQQARRPLDHRTLEAGLNRSVGMQRARPSPRIHGMGGGSGEYSRR